tara:strand:+ start:110 stop:304 length:195 start_codon:yes stop_codon:yes gene_type:complete
MKIANIPKEPLINGATILGVGSGNIKYTINTNNTTISEVDRDLEKSDNFILIIYYMETNCFSKN